jgi:AcrR family transcriptional regulator
VSTSSTRADSYHHGDLRRALIAAARQILAEGGIERISLREVARRAGVSAAAPYRHFDSRHDLLGAIATQGFGELAQVLDAAAVDAGTQNLAALGRAYVRFALAQPQLFRLMFDAQTGACEDPALREAAESTYQRLADAAAGAGQSGTEGPLTAISAWSLVHGLSLLLLDGQLARVHPADPDALADAVTAQFVRGLAGRG